MSLVLKNLSISIEEKQIIEGLDLTVDAGEIHLIMGPNGSGKSTLANALMGHPSYTLDSGTIALDTIDMTELTPDKRAKAGLFLSMQYPPSVPGVTVLDFLRKAVEARTGQEQDPLKFFGVVQKQLGKLKMDMSFLRRHINTGFSGGEKKKGEMLQLFVLKPTVAILDETDSGLDIDALKIVAEAVRTFRSEGGTVLLITHYTRMARLLEPDKIHIMKQGRVVASGGAELIDTIEHQGYELIGAV